jgi:anti-sigma factor RsiW
MEQYRAKASVSVETYRPRNSEMKCGDFEVLLHALIDGELDAGHAHEVEAHAADCSACAAKLTSFRTMHEMISGAGLKETAPAHLRNRIEALLAPASRVVSMRQFMRPTRRSFFGGFAMGSALSAAAATGLVLTVIRGNQEQTIADEVVSAHIRSLQAGHLMDVETSDQHTVKPWFNGRVDVAPPVVDLTAEGFTLLGGRLDYIDSEPVAAIIYQRRKHLINLFVAQHLGTKRAPRTVAESIQGFNVRHWSEDGLNLWAVSDIVGDELDEFVQKIASALPRSSSRS